MPHTTLPFRARLNKVLRKRSNTENLPQREIEISAPFNFKHEAGTNLPGISPDQLDLMREQAIASVALVSYNENKPRHKAHSSQQHLEPFRPYTN